jgi:hypothetical protein
VPSAEEFRQPYGGRKCSFCGKGVSPEVTKEMINTRILFTYFEIADVALML